MKKSLIFIFLTLVHAHAVDEQNNQIEIKDNTSRVASYVLLVTQFYKMLLDRITFDTTRTKRGIYDRIDTFVKDMQQTLEDDTAVNNHLNSELDVVLQELEQVEEERDVLQQYTQCFTLELEEAEEKSSTLQAALKKAQQHIAFLKKKNDALEESKKKLEKIAERFSDIAGQAIAAHKKDFSTYKNILSEAHKTRSLEISTLLQLLEKCTQDKNVPWCNQVKQLVMYIKKTHDAVSTLTTKGKDEAAELHEVLEQFLSIQDDVIQYIKNMVNEFEQNNSHTQTADVATQTASPGGYSIPGGVLITPEQRAEHNLAVFLEDYPNHDTLDRPHSR